MKFRHLTMINIRQQLLYRHTVNFKILRCNLKIYDGPDKKGSQAGRGPRAASCPPLVRNKKRSHLGKPVIVLRSF
jgi:hypothetical protein